MSDTREISPLFKADSVMLAISAQKCDKTCDLRKVGHEITVPQGQRSERCAP
jgi:hypothetical protein